jgi:hypothetical protein
MPNLSSTETILVETYDNHLTDRSDDRYGRVVHIASVTEDELIARTVEEGTDLKSETIKAAYNLLKRVALKAVCRGEIVNFGLGYTTLDVEGSFIGDAPQWDGKTNRLTARITASKELREALKATPVRVLGKAQEGNVINAVTDVATGKANEVLTPGGMANIKGNKIKIAGDSPDIGLFLTNQDTAEAVAVPMTAIGANDPSKIAFVIPATLVAGNYLLSIVTQYTGSSGRFLNEPRTITLNYVLAVE